MRINFFRLICGWPCHSDNKDAGMLLEVTGSPSLEGWCGRATHPQGCAAAGGQGRQAGDAWISI